MDRFVLVPTKLFVDFRYFNSDPNVSCHGTLLEYILTICRL